MRYSFIKRILCGLTLMAFMASSVPGAYGQGFLNLPLPGSMVPLSSSFDPPVLKGIKVYPEDPFRFDFILDKGDGMGTDEQLKADTNRLIKYFLASLTVPENDLWVNLSPYEKDRIIPEAFGQTEMGRDLLAQDYLLKQITASVIYPEDKLGKVFWQRVYDRAKEKYGTIDIPVDTFNKVWIVPEKAIVYENVGTGAVYVVGSKLRVMLESDHIAMDKFDVKADSGKGASEAQELGQQVLKDVIIPALEKEVNTGENFVRLRQVYHSLILATWYKKRIRESLLSQVYVDRKKVKGVNVDDPQITQKIWNQYVDAFKKGAFNYIKEEQDVHVTETVTRKYFSGGFDMGLSKVLEITDNASISVKNKLKVSVVLMSAQGSLSDGAMRVTQDGVAIPIPLKEVVLSAEGKKQYLADGNVRIRAIKQKIIDGVQRIPFDQFLEALDAAVDKFDKVNKRKSKEPYAVIWGYSAHTSQRWVYELVSSRLTQKPAMAFYFTDAALKRAAAKGIKHFVVMDDAVYSGIQMMEMINALKDRLPPGVHLSVVVPFMLPYGEEYLTEEYEDVDFYTVRQLPQMGDIISEKDKEILQKKYGRGEDAFFDQYDLVLGRSYFDHKAADTWGFPVPIRELIEFYDELDAPYKRSGTDYYQKEETEYKQQRELDEAADASQNPGGIDLTAQRLDLQELGSSEVPGKGPGRGIKFIFNPALLAKFNDAPGLTPVIMSIQPMTDLVLIFGLNSAKNGY